jgi:hypothetical protein
MESPAHSGENPVKMLDFFLVVLGFELKTLHLLGRHSTGWAMPPALSALIILEIESCFCAQAELDCNPPILSFLAVTGMTCRCHHGQSFVLLLRWGLTNSFASADFVSLPSNLDYRCEPSVLGKEALILSLMG